MGYLDGINLETLKKLNEEQLTELAREIREFLIGSVSKTGGHLASNLGVVELTIALHRVFDCPADRIVWDVGHQAYVHKILTGRGGEFSRLRQYGGLSGFPRPCESPCDCFGAGHSSTSLSAALGMARARDLQGKDYQVVAVIGDGAMTGGMAYEALNDAGRKKQRLIVILNDNEMSISRNVGAVELHLSKLRARKGYLNLKKRISSRYPKLTRGLERIRNNIKYMLLPSTFFEELGFKYLGPIDGHDIPSLESVLQSAKNFEQPVLIHVLTKKGKGYQYAEEDPERYHGVAPFRIENGDPLRQGARSNSSVMGERLCELAREDERIVAVTAAMPDGTGLTPFAQQFPQRFFDVGIAEQHGVTLCAGMAAGGLKPVFAVYSTFLQRGYDQIFHDVCLQKLPVIFAVDRSGLVGEDGPTHHGAYDIGYLSQMPGLTLLSPSTQGELTGILSYALSIEGPCAIRYGRGALPAGEPLEIRDGRWPLIGVQGPVMCVACGDMVEVARGAIDLLAAQGIQAGLYNARCIKPLDTEALSALRNCRRVFTLENGVAAGGLGEQIARVLSEKGGPRIHCFTLPEEPVTCGKTARLMEAVRLTAPQIAEEMRRILQEEQL